MRQQGNMDMNRQQSIEELTGGRIKKEAGAGKKAAPMAGAAARSSSKSSGWSGSKKSWK